ncbi:MAG: right-handed parallel beta-helix repeat-containing protein [Saprospiraceae bacterium]|nr:right-handed parallel beta-helix repeat-containing protein [Saprospiraceae bacterium]
MLKRLSLLFAFLLFCNLLIGQGQIYVVTSTATEGEGSFRQAVNNAGAFGPDTIVFSIPPTDPGFDSTLGVWSIAADNTYQIPEGTVVYGGIALGSETDPRPGVEIHGNDSLITLGITGLRLEARVTLRGLIVNRFQYGIWCQFDSITIENCYVGTNAAGTAVSANGANGILLADGATNNLIQNNLISGNESAGIRFFGAQTTSNNLVGNLIGTDRSGTVSLPNQRGGIQLHAGAHGNMVRDNLISGNGQYGIWLFGDGTSENIFQDNRIGTDISGSIDLPNEIFGVVFFEGPTNNTFGPGNMVAFNGNDGVLVDGSDQGMTIQNRITQNSIHDNQGMGINNLDGGNGEVGPPSIDSVNAGLVYGTAMPGQIIELFFDEIDEGCCFIGLDTAGMTGSFQVPLPDELPDQMFLTATATDNLGNTSEFSEPFCLSRPTDFLSGPDTYCEGMSIHLNAGVFANYSWSNGATTEVITIQTPGVYSVTVTDSNGCTGSDSLTVVQLPQPSLSISTMETECATTVLDAGSFESYSWSTGDSISAIEVITAGMYSVMVTDSNGCVASDSVVVLSDPLMLPWVQELIGNPFNPYCDECLTLSSANFMGGPVLVFTWNASACNFTDLGFSTIYSCDGDTIQHCSTSIAGESCDPDQMIMQDQLEDLKLLWQCGSSDLPVCPSDSLDVLALPWVIDTLNFYENLCDATCAGSNAGNFLYRHAIDTNIILEFRTTCSDIVRRFYDCDGTLIYSCTAFSESGGENCDLEYLPLLESGELIWECPSTTANVNFSTDDLVSIFPTVFSSRLYINSENRKPITIFFYNGIGYSLKTISNFTANTTINTDNWPSGIIYAKIRSQNRSGVLKLFKLE